ncbi:Mss4-like protein [Pyronema omphalodes]|nr:Mss4-like protein [Pyronema omphalodes]
MSTPITGSCLCRSLKLVIPAGITPIKTLLCHCIDCQKNSGAPFQSNAMFNTADIILEDPQGVLKTYQIAEGTASGKPKEKGWCGNCGCQVYTKPGHYEGRVMVVKTGFLDGGADHFPPQMEIFTADRAKFLAPAEGVKQFERMPH